MSTRLGELKRIPVSRGLPFIGNAIPFIFGDSDGFLNQQSDKYGEIFNVKALGQSIIYIYSVEGVKFILENDNNLFTGSLPKSTQALFGPSTLTFQAGDVHSSRRKIISKAFIPRALQSYSQGMIELTDRFLDRWSKLGSFDWHEEINKYTFDIACKMLIGVDNASELSLRDDYKMWGDGFFAPPISLPGSKYSKAISAKQRILQFINEQIEARSSQDLDSHNDVLGILLVAEDDDGYKLTEDEIRDQILSLLFAGHGTLTSALSSFCLLLTCHPQIQEQCRAEVSSSAFSHDLDIKSLKEMAYLNSVLQEILRLLPPVGGGFRRALKDCEYKGYLIPKDSTVFYSIRYMHHSNERYPEQHIFNPERYSKKEILQLNKGYQYIPYGRGIRDCLGREFANLEMMIFSSLLLARHTWDIPNASQIKFNTLPFIHPIGGLPVCFE